MTFEEAKQRNDYKYMLNGIEDCIEKIRNNWMHHIPKIQFLIEKKEH